MELIAKLLLGRGEGRWGRLDENEVSLNEVFCMKVWRGVVRI